MLVGLTVYDMDASERATHVMTLVGFGAVGVMATGQHHRVRREEFLVLREQRRTNALLVDEVEAAGEALESELQWLADHDPLTGVPNRRALLRLAEQAASARRASASHMGVLVIDADHFKDVNDRFGHGIGDLALPWVRVGVSVDPSARRRHRAHRRRGVRGGPAHDRPRPVEGDGRTPQQRVAATTRDGVPGAAISVGVATFDPRHDMLEDVVQHADRAMYTAKGAGHEHVECAVDCPSES